MSRVKRSRDDRLIGVFVWVVALTGSGRVLAQTFDVASVKPRESTEVRFGDPTSMPSIRPLPGGRFRAVNIDLGSLIEFAYALADRRLLQRGDPLLDQRFDVEARAAADVQITPRTEIGPFNRMLQKLLAERFKLVVRWENRELPVYVLSRARPDGTLGRGLRLSECPPPAPLPAPGSAAPLVRTASGRRCGGTSTINGVMEGGGVSMTIFARLLSASLDRLVLDRTELSGQFDVDTRFNMADLPFYAGRIPEGGPTSAYPSIFTAFREDLGLKLEPRRESVPVLIVEHVEPLIAN